MKIDIIISADDIKNEKIENKTVIVIDMLRATSVIVTAMNNGCVGVIPVLTVEDASEIVRNSKEEFMLGGERNALKIEGFHYSNSPLEYTRKSIEGKTLVMTTTNGTKAIKGCSGASNILIGAMLNAKAIASRIVSLNKDVVIVNAGTYGEFSIDDFLCSGYIIDCILKLAQTELADIAVTSHYIYKNNEDIHNFIKYANHYKTIMKLGLSADLEYCCQKDIIDIVPEYKGGVIL
ncbi:2-phosphosulfolactate phosphatase family protein [Clostridium estertheticum]|uniref:Probable 2-phosphosulfolactate phosphatase n=1 Tax=Clostridium estertheticum TaxID=238834 RepID=A0AA47EI67_9CLOT|nr:2-phosphosulfolactate phosphatase family protein [Clostridium estertheticum]MBU3156249.1 2-phosphosulfolactate phosphatase family protein [Clostridium estertheticum]MBU3200752.1 2-phosphosulfolactate phosphatase family protein [Clostridium estertheticum]WAG59854.1 2-phosphosulfolactate phosphatase family protein [Clostridium estertheticum]WAG66076.1 2-phosphosulfolactate phosphatase family protein [Clostridium estertheticum]